MTISRCYQSIIDSFASCGYETERGGLFVREAPEILISEITGYLGIAFKYFRNINWKGSYIKKTGKMASIETR